MKDLRSSGPHQRLVLLLGPPEGRLLGHHALPLGGQLALLAYTHAVLAVPLVALEGYLQAVVAAPGTVRRRTRRIGRAGSAGVECHFRLVLFGGHHAAMDARGRATGKRRRDGAFCRSNCHGCKDEVSCTVLHLGGRVCIIYDWKSGGGKCMYRSAV